MPWTVVQLATLCSTVAFSIGEASSDSNKQLEQGEDSFVLAQWTYRVNPTTLEAEPSGVYALPDPSTASSPDMQTVWDVLNMVPQALRDREVQKKGAVKLSRQNPSGGSDDLMNGGNIQQMMDFISGISKAVRSDDFMSNMTNFLSVMKKNTEDLHQQAKGMLKQFLVSSKSATPEEIPDLFVDLVNGVGNSTRAFRKTYMQGIQTAYQFLPDTMRDIIGGSLNATLPQEATSLPSMGPVSTANVCPAALERLSQLDTVAEAELQALDVINASSKMMPMLKNLLTQTRPDVAPRVMFLMDTFTDAAHDIGTNILGVFQTLSTGVKPTLQTKLNCDVKGAARPSASLAPVALFSAVLAFLWLGA